MATRNKSPERNPLAVSTAVGGEGVEPGEQVAAGRFDHATGTVLQCDFDRNRLSPAVEFQPGANFEPGASDTRNQADPIDGHQLTRVEHAQFQLRFLNQRFRFGVEKLYCERLGKRTGSAARSREAPRLGRSRRHCPAAARSAGVESRANNGTRTITVRGVALGLLTSRRALAGPLGSRLHCVSAGPVSGCNRTSSRPAIAAALTGTRR